MKTVIVNTSKFNHLSIEEAICSILSENSQNDFQVSDELINDYKAIIEYDNEAETSIDWYIVETNYNEDGTLYSVDLDC